MNQKATQGNSAEARLTLFYLIGLGRAKLVPVSFRDIGMKSIKELEETFASFDLAIQQQNTDEIQRCLTKLLGQKKMAYS